MITFRLPRASRASVGVSEEGDTERQERQWKERILSEHIMGKTIRRVGWGGMETKGRCLWPTLVTVTAMLKFLIIVASPSWQWSEDMEMMPGETFYSTVSMPTSVYTRQQYKAQASIGNHTQAQIQGMLPNVKYKETTTKGLKVVSQKCPAMSCITIMLHQFSMKILSICIIYRQLNDMY